MGNAASADSFSMYSKFVLAVLLVLFPFTLQAKSRPQDAIRAAGLADYIAGDYKGAVANEGGKILSESEYKEMGDFSSLILHYLESFSLPPQSPLLSQGQKLDEAIKGKKSVGEVSALAANLKNGIIDYFSLPTEPKEKPDLEKGARIYNEHCAVCHGEDGSAHTAAAVTLDPKPVAFTDPDIISNLNPFKAFATVSFGVNGTAMKGFSTVLSERDRWNVVSRLFTFGAGPKVGGDEEKPNLRGIGRSKELLFRAVEAARAGDFDEALNLSVSSYLDGFESAESVISATQGKEVVAKVEASFLNLRKGFHDKDPGSIALGQTLIQDLERIQQFSQKKKVFSPWVAFIASFMIIFREGLEAILLLAIILSAIENLKDDKLRRWVHGSWIAALAAGFLTYLLAARLISGSVREGMEGWVSLIAAVVLIYVSYWLFAKRDSERWKQYLVGKIKNKKSLGFLTLASVAFMAVYREAFETILFIEALQLEAKDQGHYLFLGFLFSAVVLVAVAWMILKIGKKIPLQIFFGVSGMLLYALAVIFVGQGIHSLQEANVISQTPIPFFTMEILGIFPYAESFVPQFILSTLFIIGLLWQQTVKRPQQTQKLEKEMAHTSLELLNLHELGEHLKEHLSALKNKFAKGAISEVEMKEVIGHMEDLDEGIHNVILQLDRLQQEIPGRFDELYQEVESLEQNEEHKKVLEQARQFKIHLECLRHRSN